MATTERMGVAQNVNCCRCGNSFERRVAPSGRVYVACRACEAIRDRARRARGGGEPRTPILENYIPVPGPGCWLWLGEWSPHGYGRVGSRSRLMAHRVIYAAVNGPIPDGLWVLHKCDTRACVNPDHLFLGTSADNVRDMWAKGRAMLFGNPQPAGSKRKFRALLSEAGR